MATDVNGSIVSVFKTVFDSENLTSSCTQCRGGHTIINCLVDFVLWTHYFVLVMRVFPCWKFVASQPRHQIGSTSSTICYFDGWSQWIAAKCNTAAGKISYSSNNLIPLFVADESAPSFFLENFTFFLSLSLHVIISFGYIFILIMKTLFNHHVLYS